MQSICQPSLQVFETCQAFQIAWFQGCIDLHNWAVFKSLRHSTGLVGYQDPYKSSERHSQILITGKHKSGYKLNSYLSTDAQLSHSLLSQLLLQVDQVGRKGLVHFVLVVYQTAKAGWDNHRWINVSKSPWSFLSNNQRYLDSQNVD